MSRVLGVGGEGPFGVTQHRADLLSHGPFLLHSLLERPCGGPGPCQAGLETLLTSECVLGFSLPGGISCCCFSEILGIEGKAPGDLLP